MSITANKVIKKTKQDIEALDTCSNQSGVCPICGCEVLDYGAIQLEGEQAYFKWQCSQCKTEGEEWYSMSFIGHNVYDKENDNWVEIEDNMIEEV